MGHASPVSVYQFVYQLVYQLVCQLVCQLVYTCTGNRIGSGSGPSDHFYLINSSDVLCLNFKLFDSIFNPQCQVCKANHPEYFTSSQCIRRRKVSFLIPTSPPDAGAHARTHIYDSQIDRDTHKRTVWASLITNVDYLPGILTLHHTLVHVQKTAYPFYAFYTAAFPTSGLEVLAARGIPTRLVPPIYPSHSRVYEQDPRFQETWTKLGVFGLWGAEGEFERIVLLDGDMLVRRGIDELMDVELDDPASGLAGTEVEAKAGGSRVFAACHACACNPLKKPHYPKSWYIDSSSPYPLQLQL